MGRRAAGRMSAVFPDLVPPARNAGQRALLTKFVRYTERDALTEEEALVHAMAARRAHMVNLALYGGRVRRARARRRELEDA